eukprot:TRINITY_DN35543_c0_g1_i1.p1 TRINITY_DN35543_c0_g1~~TRINITY_DN35543_c0_g1_i1.p1  ORF type:complete len:181 (+),score=24.62 TRINITY_DN35543_c0_g1_i1:198-740(+)
MAYAVVARLVLVGSLEGWLLDPSKQWWLDGWWTLGGAHTYFWADVLGGFCGWISVVSIVWVHHHLARNWSPIVQADQVRSLVKTGPYALCRHPMYFSFICQILGLSFGTPTWYCVFVTLATVIVFLFRIPREDRILEEAFGEEFRQWKRVTPALFPYGSVCRRWTRRAEEEPMRATAASA